MASLGDLVQAWTSCGREFNGVRGLYRGTIKVGRDCAFAHDYNYGLWGAGHEEVVNAEKVIRPMDQKSL